MPDHTKIPWTDETFNPFVGCTPVSEGCKNCYAKSMAVRFHHPTNDPFKAQGLADPFQFRVIPERMDPSYSFWKNRRLSGKSVFVGSMGDVMHPNMPFEYVDEMLNVFLGHPKTLWLMLTKRAERLVEYYHAARVSFPLPNVWWGVTAENQDWASERIPLLLAIPNVCPFVSIEPILGPVDLSLWLPAVKWVIVGPENAQQWCRRPYKQEWMESLKAQCDAAHVAFFDKRDQLIPKNTKLFLGRDYPNEWFVNKKSLYQLKGVS